MECRRRSSRQGRRGQSLRTKKSAFAVDCAPSGVRPTPSPWRRWSSRSERYLSREGIDTGMDMKRRSFLSWGAAGLVALWAAVGVSLAAVVRFLTPSVFYEPPQTFKIGNPGDFPFGPPTFLAEEKIFVFRDREKGFAVANAVCTHLGCTVGYFQSDQ